MRTIAVLGLLPSLLIACQMGTPGMITDNGQPGDGQGGGGGGGGGDDGGGDDGGGDDGGGDDGGGDSPDGGPTFSGCIGDSAPFDLARITEQVGYLSSDAMRGRLPGSAEDDMTRTFIEERFTCLGLTPGHTDGYQQPFTAGGYASANVVGYIQGSDPAVGDEIIVIGAHHDHLGMDGNTVMNGANDNASGTVTMLAIAQAFQQRGTPPRRTIAFAAFGNEEEGLYGSYHWAESPPAFLPMTDTVYMINLDMLGRYSYENQFYAWGTFAGTPGRVALDQILVDHPALNFDIGGPSPEGDSDFQGFCDEDVPYVYFANGEDECWHEACDDLGWIEFPQMIELGEITFELAAALADTDTSLVGVGCAGP